MKQIHVFTVFLTPEMFFDGQFKYLSEQGYEIILVSSYAEQAYSFAARNNIRYCPVKIPRSLSPISILKAIVGIVKIIKREKPDVVFGHTPVGALCAMIASIICRVRNRVYYRHGVIFTTMTGVKRLLFQYEEKFISSLATQIINVSHSLSKLAIEYNLNPDSKQHVIGHGTCGGIDAINKFNPDVIDEQRLLQMKKSLGLLNADIVFGFCGRICNDKGIKELVKGFELFQKKNRSIKSKLVLIGFVDERDSIEESTKLIIENNTDIIITGFVDKQDTPYYYSLLDVFVFPSHREGFGMVAIEAAAMEKPVLVSKSHGCIDSIVEHETGEYVDMTPESICEKMELMNNVELRNKLGENGRKRVLECYDCRVMWPLVAQLYNEILI